MEPGSAIKFVSLLKYHAWAIVLLHIACVVTTALPTVNLAMVNALQAGILTAMKSVSPDGRFLRMELGSAITLAKLLKNHARVSA